MRNFWYHKEEEVIKIAVITVVRTQKKSPIIVMISRKKHKLALPCRWKTWGTDPEITLLWSCRTSKIDEVAQPRRSGAMGRKI